MTHTVTHGCNGPRGEREREGDREPSSESLCGEVQMEQSDESGFKDNADQRTKMLMFWSLARGHSAKLKCFGRVEVCTRAFARAHV